MPKISQLDFIEIKSTSIKESWDENSVWAPTLPCFIVRVTAEDGTEGFGEVASQTWYLGETSEQIRSCLTLYASRLKGAEATNLAAANHVMDKAYSGAMPGGRSARSGVDVALHDLLGKLWGVPVTTLLGGARRQRMDLLTNLYHKTPEEMAAASKTFVERGFKGLKIKIGDVIWKDGFRADSLATEAGFLEAALDVVPRDVFIDADANQAWTNPGIVVRRLERFASASNLAIEQPLHYANIEGHCDIRRRSTIPVILDESVWSPEAAMEVVRRGACDRIVLKVNRVGGLSQARDVITICESAGIGISVDTSPYSLLGDTAIAHVAMTTRGHYPLSCDGHETFIKLADPSIYKGGVDISQGYAELPDAPGLGIEVDWQKLEKIAI
ncbi:L-alanine-DL-glutamate epimerase-like enolase superfamily enzyme [Rhodoligotrophos appendicifer]|uniref:mandelate racemase/muconate lactonizing enzyme family protein n=1 Tax=Rhodoligotrophos appendicifer TaxID=987056 RepID=UPI00118654B4|nr:mandelate racemase/muconate lactonizing enzyme family protein [Rhodoligotrophos appendicifer]